MGGLQLEQTEQGGIVDKYLSFSWIQVFPDMLSRTLGQALHLLLHKQCHVEHMLGAVLHDLKITERTLTTAPFHSDSTKP